MAAAVWDPAQSEPARRQGLLVRRLLERGAAAPRRRNHRLGRGADRQEQESAAEFIAELKNLAGAKPISETELTAARLTKIRGYAQQFESLDRVSGQVVNLWALGLPMIELQREPESLLGASVAAVNAAGAKYAAPAGTTLLLVGDGSKIERACANSRPATSSCSTSKAGR